MSFSSCATDSLTSDVTDGVADLGAEVSAACPSCGRSSGADGSTEVGDASDVDSWFVEGAGSVCMEASVSEDVAAGGVGSSTVGFSGSTVGEGVASMCPFIL